MAQTLSMSSAANHTLSELAELFTRGFQGYAVPTHVTAEALAERIRVESIDVAASRVVMRGGKPVLLALVARRGWHSRIAAMGVTVEARGAGVGRFAMSRIAEEARTRGEKTLLLEVVETNASAVALYTRAGFRVKRRLVAYRAASIPPTDASLLERVDPSDVGRQLAQSLDEELPWQLASTSIAQLGAGTHAFHLEGKSFVAVTGVSERSLGLRCLLTLPEHRREGHATRLLGALAARFPGRAATFAAVVPETTSPDFFAHAGFEREPLTQLEMELELGKA
jgi:ribosomal protein S18 acetylase RimI-like enzyme